MSQTPAADRRSVSLRAGVAGDFYRGLTLPNWPALAICFSLVAIAFLALLFGLTADIVSRYGDRLFTADPFDFELYATVDALSLSRNSREGPIVIVTGGSTIREAMSKDLLEGHFNSRLYPAPRVFKLTTAFQTLAETAGFLEMIPDGARGGVIVGVTPPVLFQGPAGNRPSRGNIGFRSTVLDRERAEHGFARRYPTGNYLIDNWSFFLPRLSLPLTRLTRPLARGDLEFLSREPLSREERQTEDQDISDRWDNLQPEALEESFEFIREMIEELQGRTLMSVLIVEAPVSDGFLREYDRETMFHDIRKRTQTLAIEMGVDYIDLNSSLDLPDSAFYDWAHLSDMDAVVRCTELVAHRASEIMTAAAEAHVP